MMRLFKKEVFKDIPEKFKNDNGVIAFRYMSKYGINAGRNDVWNYIKFLLDKKLYFFIPLFCFYCQNIKFKNQFLDKLFWNKKWVKVLYRISVLS